MERRRLRCLIFLCLCFPFFLSSFLSFFRLADVNTSCCGSYQDDEVLLPLPLPLPPLQSTDRCPRKASRQVFSTRHPTPDTSHHFTSHHSEPNRERERERELHSTVQYTTAHTKQVGKPTERTPSDQTRMRWTRYCRQHVRLGEHLPISKTASPQERRSESS